MLGGCATTQAPPAPCPRPQPAAPVTHQVARGETADKIAAHYGTSPAELLEYNGLRDQRRVVTGMVLKIPPARSAATSAQASSVPRPWWNNAVAPTDLADAQRVFSRDSAASAACRRVPGKAPASPGNPAEQTRSTSVAAAGGAPTGGSSPGSSSSYTACARRGQASGQGMEWPLTGSISRGFDSGRHRGMDICAEPGTPIVAARSGKVLYAGDKLSGFGNMVIIDHGGDLASIYAHNRRNLVRSGQRVNEGQLIAEVGQTGNATTPHCHFELRRHAKPIDPRPLLP